MKTLVSTIDQTHISISYLASRNQKPLILHSQTTSFKPVAHSRISSTAWKLQAEAKGFGSISPEKRVQREGNPITGKSSGNNNNDDDEIPQVVYNRMVGRILFSVGVPMGIGLGLLSLFGLVTEQNLWDVPIWLPVVTTFITFGSSALGIAYGTLSTSWDPERNGSFLGVEQLEPNWNEMWKEEEEEEEAKNRR